MEVETVALDAEIGFVLLQEIVCNRTVGPVADGAVLNHRGVFEGVGTALVLVALQAELVLGLICPEKRADFRAMGIVAVRAYEFSFLNRVVVGESCLGEYILVAGEAELGFRLLQELAFLILVPVAKLVPCCKLVLFAVDGVAAYAGHIVEVVFGAVPVHKIPFCVALKTDGVGFLGLHLCGIDDQ